MLTGTPAYMAPELFGYIQSPKFDEKGHLITKYDPKKTDAYSLGCILLQVFLKISQKQLSELNLND